MSERKKSFRDDADVAVATRKSTGTGRPKKYKVLLHNDDYTTMDFVVEILETLFHKSPGEATQITLTVHRKGQGVAGIYPREIAESKVEQVHTQAAQHGFPLRATFEPE